MGRNKGDRVGKLFETTLIDTCNYRGSTRLLFADSVLRRRYLTFPQTQ